MRRAIKSCSRTRSGIAAEGFLRKTVDNGKKTYDIKEGVKIWPDDSSSVSVAMRSANNRETIGMLDGCNNELPNNGTQAIFNLEAVSRIRVGA